MPRIYGVGDLDWEEIHAWTRENYLKFVIWLIHPFDKWIDGQYHVSGWYYHDEKGGWRHEIPDLPKKLIATIEALLTTRIEIIEWKIRKDVVHIRLEYKNYGLTIERPTKFMIALANRVNQKINKMGA